MSKDPAPAVVPALRILLPFVAGILVHRLWHCWWAPLLLLLAAVIGYLLLLAIARTPQHRLQQRHRFILPLATAALALGWLSAIVHCPARLTVEQRNERILTGQITDLDYTDFSMKMIIDVLDADLPPCRVLVTTRGCDYTLRVGDLMAWKAALAEVGNQGNPGEMDYAAHLRDSKGVRYQQHLPASHIKRVGHHASWSTRMAALRRDLQLMVFNSSLSTGAQQFVVALLLGDSMHIDKATRSEFSAAGVAHVLALSGMHVGFLAFIIWCLLFPLDYLGLKKLRLVFTLVVMALFALFTGSSPSVVRATVMMGFVSASFIFHRRSVSLNALLIAALGILVFFPSAIYGAGFQLSFITVAAILLLARVPHAIESRYKLVNYLTATATTSLVAMLATVALSAHYFHTISWLSVVANLLILPIMPVFMVIGALFLLLTAAGVDCQVVNATLDTCYNYIHWSAASVSSLPLAHTSGVYVSTAGVALYFLILALLMIWYYRRDARFLLGATACLATLIAHSIWIDASTPRHGVVFFNSFNSTPLLYYRDGTGYVWIPDDLDTDSAAFHRYYEGFLAQRNIDKLRFVGPGDSLRAPDVWIKPPLAWVMGQRMVAVGSGKWKRYLSQQRLVVDDVIVTRRFHGTVADLKRLYDFERLIISGGLYDKGALKAQCDSLGVSRHDLSTDGALEMSR